MKLAALALIAVGVGWALYRSIAIGRKVDDDEWTHRQASKAWCGVDYKGLTK